MAYRISSNQERVPKGKVRFEFDLYVDGFRHRRTQTCQKSAVPAFHKRWEKRILDHLDGNYTLFEKFDEYLKYSEKMKSPRMFRHELMIIEQVAKQFFSKKFLLRDMRRSHAEDFIAWRRNHVVSVYDNTREGGRLSDATINRTIAFMSFFFNWAIKKEYFNGLNPFYLSKLREVNAREVKLTPEQIQEMLGKAHKQDYRLGNLVSFALHTGMRRNEMFSLKWSEVDFDASSIRLSQYKTKSRKARVIPMSPSLKDLLLSMKNRNPESEYVIVGYTPEMLRKQWHKLRTRLPFGKLNDGTLLHFHDLRHVFAQVLLDRGISLEDIQTLLGHESFTTTQKRYAMFARPDMVEKVTTIDNIVRLRVHA